MKEQMPKKWIDYHQKEMEKFIRDDCQRAMYTAQEGSKLDRIWKGEFMSKEQTLTAEDFDRVIRQINAVDTSLDQWDVRKQKIDILKEFTQAKVLEALEKLPRYDIDDRGNFVLNKDGALIPYWAIQETTKQK